MTEQISRVTPSALRADHTSGIDVPYMIAEYLANIWQARSHAIWLRLVRPRMPVEEESRIICQSTARHLSSFDLPEPHAIGIEAHPPTEIHLGKLPMAKRAYAVLDLASLILMRMRNLVLGSVPGRFA